jgi:hypothetical protein
MSGTAKVELYQAAAEVLARVNKGEGIRRIIYSASVPPKMRPQLSAVVQGVKQHDKVIKKVLNREGQLQKSVPQDKMAVLMVLVYQQLLGSRSIRGLDPLVQSVKDHKVSLKVRAVALLHIHPPLQKTLTLQLFRSYARPPSTHCTSRARCRPRSCASATASARSSRRRGSVRAACSASSCTASTSRATCASTG